MESAAQTVVDYLDGRPDRVVDVARRLVRYNTVFLGPGTTPNEERAAQAWVASHLDDLGLSVDQWEPDPAALHDHPMYSAGLDWRERPITVGALRGAGGGRSLILNGHLDTVAADPVERWTRPPWEGVVEGDRLYGRGACDMKGGIACFLVAVEAVVRSGVRLAGDVIIQVVTDEETTGMGTVAAIERGYRADACLVPEPTDFAIWTAYRGILYANVAVSGRPAHGEIPQPHWRAGGAVNAIDKMRLVLDAVDALNREWWGRPDKRHDLLANPQVVPTTIRGGEFVASFPAECETTLDLTYLPADVDERGYGGRVRAEVEGSLRGATDADPWLREHPPRITWFADYPAAETSPDEPFVLAMRRAAEAEGDRPRIAGMNSWADAASYLLAGVPAICYGPGAIERAHVLDEYVSISELQRCARTIARLIVDWCGVA